VEFSMIFPMIFVFCEYEKTGILTKSCDSTAIKNNLFRKDLICLI